MELKTYSISHVVENKKNCIQGFNNHELSRLPLDITVPKKERQNAKWLDSKNQNEHENFEG
jgi:hypothetical protein